MKLKTLKTHKRDTNKATIMNVLLMWHAFLFCSMTQGRIQDFGLGGALARGSEDLPQRGPGAEPR